MSIDFECNNCMDLEQIFELHTSDTAMCGALSWIVDAISIIFKASFCIILLFLIMDIPILSGPNATNLVRDVK